jgi:transcriptional regulator with XRE-family HTH domain
MDKGNRPLKEEKQPMAQSALKNEDVFVKELDKNKYYESGFPKEMKRKKYGLTVSDRLKEARKRSGLSLSEVETELGKVENLGIKAIRSTIQGYEAPETNKNHRYPSIHILYNLCRIYNVNVDYIFGFSEEMSRPSEELFDHLDNATNVVVEGVVLEKEEIEFLKLHARRLIEHRKINARPI